MVLWRDYRSLSGFHRGWHVVAGRLRNTAETKFIASPEKLFHWLREYMSVDTATLLLPTANGQDLAVKATLGLEEEIRQQIRIPIGQGFAGAIAAQNEPIIVDDLSTIKVVSPVLQHKGLRSLVGIPIPIMPGAVGVLHVGTTELRRFNECDIEQLQLVAMGLQQIMVDAN